MSLLEVLKQSILFKLCFAITFFTSGLIINLIQLILYVCVRTWNKRLYRKINSYLCITLYAQLVFIGDWWSGVDLVIYADKDEFNKYWGKEHAYCIMNHTYEIDWLLMMMLADRQQMLGNTKAYVKKALQYLPVLGWAWKLSDFVMLERSFEKDKKTIRNQITELCNYPDPMWLVFFPEGTRFTADKHKASEDFAQQNHLPKLKHHLQPRTKGFISSLPSMKGKVSAIYDMTLMFKNNNPVKPTLMNLLMGKTTTAYWYMNRIPMEDLRESENHQEKFLRNLFVKKDKIRDSFEESGDFFTTSGIERVTPFRIKRRTYVFFNMTGWAIAIFCPLMYFLIKLLFSGHLLSIAIVLGVLVFFFGLMSKAVGMSKTSQGSSYGTVHKAKRRSVELV